jgi:hypothetical protein
MSLGVSKETTTMSQMTEFEIKALELLQSIDQSLAILKERAKLEERSYQAKLDMMNRDTKSMIEAMKSSQSIDQTLRGTQGPSGSRSPS